MNEELPTPEDDQTREAELKAKSEIAKRYGYYYDVLNPEEGKRYLLARKDPGMEADIAVLRNAIDKALAEHPNDLKLINDAMKTLAKLQAMNLEIRKEHPLPPLPAGLPES